MPGTLFLTLVLVPCIPLIVKSRILSIFFLCNIRLKLLSSEHLAGFLQIPSPQRLSWAARIDTDLVTPDRDADFDQLHVAAMALGRAIHITDIQTHQTQVIDTLCPWLPNHAVTGPPLRVAYCRHKVLWAYHQDASPIGPLGGHYWAIVPIAQAAPGPRRSARQRAPVALLMSDHFDYNNIPVRRRRTSRSSLNMDVDPLPSPSLSIWSSTLYHLLPKLLTRTCQILPLLPPAIWLWL